MLNIAKSLLQMLSLQCCGLEVAVSRVVVCMPKVGKQLGQPPASMKISTYKPAQGAYMYQQRRKRTHWRRGESSLTRQVAAAQIYSLSLLEVILETGSGNSASTLTGASVSPP